MLCPLDGGQKARDRAVALLRPCERESLLARLSRTTWRNKQAEVVVKPLTFSDEQYCGVALRRKYRRPVALLRRICKNVSGHV